MVIPEMSDGPGIRLVAGGDIMFGEHPNMVGRGTASAILENPEFDPLAGIQEFILAADISLANLESVLSDPKPKSSPSDRECRGPERGITLLQRSGLTALNVANNHIQQHGEMAFKQTIEALGASGLGVVGRAAGGYGSVLAWDTEIKGLQLRILGYSLRPRQHFDGTPLYAEGPEDRIIEDVTSGRESGRSVIVSIHWGDEFMPVPSRAQVTLGRRIIDAGASLVLGHHPHVLQGWESYHGGVIVYSLGNLVFDMPWLESLRRTALFTCNLTPEGVNKVKWVPLRIGDDFSPHIPDPQTASEILKFLEESKKNLESGVGQWSAPLQKTYESILEKHDSEQRQASQKYFIRNIFRYEPGVLNYIIGKFIRRRLGLLKD